MVVVTNNVRVQSVLFFVDIQYFTGSPMPHNVAGFNFFEREDLRGVISEGLNAES